MPYELFNPATEISRTLSGQFWSKALELARLYYGWGPKREVPFSLVAAGGSKWKGCIELEGDLSYTKCIALCLHF